MNPKNKFIIGLSSALLVSTLLTPDYSYVTQKSAKAEDITLSNTLTSRNDLLLGKQYNVIGTVSSQLGKWGAQGFYLQLDNGESVYVYPGKNELKNITLQKGDKINFTAEVGQFSNSLQLIKLKNITKLSTNNQTTIKSATVNQFSQNIIDSKLQLNNLKVKSIKSQGNYKNTIITAIDQQGNIVEIFADNRAVGNFDVVSKLINKNTEFNSVSGFLALFNNKYQLKVENIEDFVIKSQESTPVNEAENIQPVETPTSNIKVVANIGEIQGASHTSPLVGKEVRLENVVVTKLDGKKGFYVQDISPDNNSSTSDAIYVVSKNKVTVGDKLNLEGRVSEIFGLGYQDKNKTDLTITQLAASKVEKVGKSDLPTPIVLGDNIPKNNIEDDAFANFEPDLDALDFWESIEGMLVKVPSPQILGPQKYGNLYVLPEGYIGERNNANGISLRPDGYNTEVIPLLISNKNFVAKANDKFADSVIGNITYDFSEYKVDLRSTNLPKKIDGKLEREKSTIVFDENKLTVASYNIENFSANSSAKETPEEKVEKIANSFIKEINKPDVITLIEVQDNNGSVDDGTTSGVESGQRLANKIVELGGPKYNYLEIAPENNADGGKPGANIRVGFLYNPERVNLPNKQTASSTEAARFVDGQLEKNPARIAPNSPAFTNVRKSLAVEFEFKGEKVIVIANHLKSKNGDNPLYGKTQPAVENSRVSRIEQAKELNKFVKEGLSQNPNLKFVLTGDFNDFEFSETVKAVEGEELVNLLSTHDKADRYSYFYRGNNQSLDNIFVSKNLLENIKFDAVHVNSSFMEEHGRASDHDPLIVQLDFTKFIKKENSNTIMNAEISSTSENYPTIDLPVAEIGISDNEAPIVDLPIAEISTSPSDNPTVNLPVAEIGVSDNEAPSVDLPIAEIGVSDNEPTTVDLPVAEIETSSQKAPIVDLPIAEIGVSDNEPTSVNLPIIEISENNNKESHSENKEISSSEENIVTNLKNTVTSTEKKIEKTLNKKLPKTGITVGNASLLAAASMILIAFAIRRKVRK